MPSATASLNGTLIAQSDATVVVEGNQYFPPSALQDQSLFEKSDTHTTCPWKGLASYYNLKLSDGTVIPDAAWYVATTILLNNTDTDYFAFYKNKVNVKVQ
ncbi:DUF427-domain-containing protein [Dacryopinax primogenitus]|uniref:DUF427-domain-containing protein n=1 Tax=Dacryopinax primogenitus (strain DJM 731) TaxID=1858805 RepID=M5G535_DACPD|nr:DUF427-domain-containing protein [Dacryopinax primogenitus]EJU03335.1 DUF427-domain-containing protein [Dacryopinax primogenitus]